MLCMLLVIIMCKFFNYVFIQKRDYTLTFELLDTDEPPDTTIRQDVKVKFLWRD